MTCKILVVDDEEAIRSMIQRYLQDTGYEVDVADSFHVAIPLVQDKEYHIIITDKNMPHPNGSQESGLSLLEYVSRHHPNIEILLMTGYPTIDSAIESIKMGAFDYLIKPFSMADLKQKIERIIEHQGYVNTEEITGIYKELQKEILSLFSNKDELRLDEFNRSIDSITNKIHYFINIQNKLLKNNLRQRASLDNIISLSKELLDNASNENRVNKLAEKILKEAE